MSWWSTEHHGPPPAGTAAPGYATVEKAGASPGVLLAMISAKAAGSPPKAVPPRSSSKPNTVTLVDLEDTVNVKRPPPGAAAAPASSSSAARPPLPQRASSSASMLPLSFGFGGGGGSQPQPAPALPIEQRGRPSLPTSAPAVVKAAGPPPSTRAQAAADLEAAAAVAATSGHSAKAKALASVPPGKAPPVDPSAPAQPPPPPAAASSWWRKPAVAATALPSSAPAPGAAANAPLLAHSNVEAVRTPDNDPFLTHSTPAPRPSTEPPPGQQPPGTMLPPSLEPDDRFTPPAAFPGGGAPTDPVLRRAGNVDLGKALPPEKEAARPQQQRPPGQLTYGSAPSLNPAYKRYLLESQAKMRAQEIRVFKDIVVPLLLFLVVAFIFAFWWQAPPVPVIVTFLGLAISMQAASPPHPEDHTLCDHLPMLIVKFAVVFGVLTGLYAYEAHTSYYYVVSHGRDYKHVLASSLGAEYADAGTVEFAPSSRVDTSKGWGHEDFHRYCAAPIMDDGGDQSTMISFWAVGTDCCGHRADFECGDIDSNSQAGVRIPPDGLFAAPHAAFLQAVNRSASVFGLQVDSDPILLHWVASSSRPTGELGKAVGTCLLGVCLFALLEFTAYVARALVRAEARKGPYQA